jgi:uncharacterized membrane protein YhaH (DUF805 family)
MLKAIKHGLGNLVNVTGRDARQAFWYYVLFLYIVQMVVTTVVTVPLALRAVFKGVRAGMAGGSDDAAAVELAAQSAVVGSLAEIMVQIMWLGAALNLAMLVLLAASFVRRLHDSDLSGWWAVAPGVIQLANLAVAPALMERMMARFAEASATDPMAGMQSMQSSMGVASLLGWAGFIIVIVLGIRKSSPGANRFGGQPFVA